MDKYYYINASSLRVKENLSNIAWLAGGNTAYVCFPRDMGYNTQVYIIYLDIPRVTVAIDVR